MSTDIFADWLAALEARHLADLRVQEVTRALRALSSAYVERRQKIARGGALDTAGKRAAFALFYAPLHFLATRLVVRELGAARTAPTTIVDVGCGTGAPGAAWALECRPHPKIIGIDRHPWALAEAQWTYRQLGLEGEARRAEAARFRPARGSLGILAAWVLNELPDAARDTLLHTLAEAGARGARVLILEPIARSIAPWWDDAARLLRSSGGRSDEWRFAVELPPMLQMFDKAAGLDHRELKLRSLFVG